MKIPTELDTAFTRYEIAVRTADAKGTADARRAIVRAVLHGVTHPEAA